MKEDATQDLSFYIAGWLLIILFVLFMAAVYFMPWDLLEYLPPCSIHLVTGYYCPGCGGTRAVLALLHGNILTSFFYHPFVPYAAVFGGWFMISQTIERLSKGKVKIAMHYRNIYLWIALFLIVGHTTVKNLIYFFAGIQLMG